MDENVKFVEMNKGFANYWKNNAPIVGIINCQTTEKNDAKQPKNIKPHGRKELINWKRMVILNKEVIVIEKL